MPITSQIVINAYAESGMMQEARTFVAERDMILKGLK